MQTQTSIKFLYQFRWAILTLSLITFSNERMFNHIEQKIYMLIFCFSLVYGIYNAFIGLQLEEKKTFTEKRLIIESIIDYIFLIPSFYFAGGVTNFYGLILILPMVVASLALNVTSSLISLTLCLVSFYVLNLKSVYDFYSLFGLILFCLGLFLSVHWFKSLNKI